MQYEPKPLPFSTSLNGISEQTIQIHHGKLYAGYVTKMVAIGNRLAEIAASGNALQDANQTYSEMRALRLGETFATNGVFLHEVYFACLGGDGQPQGSLKEAFQEKWGSLEAAIAFINATCMAMRGWCVIAWDFNVGRLKMYGCDAHNHGGVWGCVPIVAIDVYEHSYFIDSGSDRMAYLNAFWKNFHWVNASSRLDRWMNVHTP